MNDAKTTISPMIEYFIISLPRVTCCSLPWDVMKTRPPKMSATNATVPIVRVRKLMIFNMNAVIEGTSPSSAAWPGAFNISVTLKLSTGFGVSAAWVKTYVLWVSKKNPKSMANAVFITFVFIDVLNFKFRRDICDGGFF